MTQSTRREFVAILGAAAVATAAPWTCLAVELPPPLIDPHFHIWDLKRFRLPWLDHAGPVLNRDYSLDDYRAAIAGLNVVKSVYVEVDVAPEQKEAEARYAIGLCGDQGRPAGWVEAAVVGGAPGTEGFAKYIRALGESPAVHGVRAPLGPRSGRDTQFVKDIVLLGQLGMSFDLLVDAAGLADAATLAESAPQTRFILDHCGNPSTTWFASGSDARPADPWRRGIALLAKQPNVACKISGVAENGPAEGATLERVAPPVNRCLDAFGPERVMFAGNWPVCLKSITIGKWVEMLRQITAPRGEQFQRKLFHDNAAKWYRLD